MEEFLGWLISGLAELLIEFLFELFLEAFLSLIIRSISPMFKAKSFTPVVSGAGYLLLGSGIGATTLWLFPHPLFHASSFHGISLLISPLLTGLAMSQVGRAIRRMGRQPVRIESFSFGFVFAFGFAVMRLVFAR